MMKTSYVKSITMQFSESPLLHVSHAENYEKMCTFKFDMNKYSSLQNQILEMPKS